MRSSIWLILVTIMLTIVYVAYAQPRHLPTDFQTLSQLAFSILNLLALLVLMATLYKSETTSDEAFGKAVRSKIDVVLTAAFLMLVYSVHQIAALFGLVSPS